MTQPKITQDNVHLLIPNKVAQLAARLIQDGIVSNLPEALGKVYSSNVYSLLEQENTKYWWLGTASLYHDMVTGKA